MLDFRPQLVVLLLLGLELLLLFFVTAARIFVELLLQCSVVLLDDVELLKEQAFVDGDLVDFSLYDGEPPQQTFFIDSQNLNLGNFRNCLVWVFRWPWLGWWDSRALSDSWWKLLLVDRWLVSGLATLIFTLPAEVPLSELVQLAQQLLLLEPRLRHLIAQIV